MMNHEPVFVGFVKPLGRDQMLDQLVWFALPFDRHRDVVVGELADVAERSVGRRELPERFQQPHHLIQRRIAQPKAEPGASDPVGVAPTKPTEEPVLLPDLDAAAKDKPTSASSPSLPREDLPEDDPAGSGGVA